MVSGQIRDHEEKLFLETVIREVYIRVTLKFLQLFLLFEFSYHLLLSSQQEAESKEI